MEGNIKIKLIISLLLTIFTFLIFSCSLFSDEEEPNKDPRTYEWTIDTLRFFNSQHLMFLNIWGTAHNNVYHVGGSQDLGYGMIHHFNGKTWENVLLHSAVGGPIEGLSMQIRDIYGFSRNDFWAVGFHLTSKIIEGVPGPEKSLILHYDGVNWERVDIPMASEIFKIGGNSPSNLFAGGTYGKLYHYDGYKWELDSIPLPKEQFSSYFSHFRAITKSTNDSVYAIASNLGGLDYLLLNHNSQWTIAGSFEYDSSLNNIWLSPSGKLYSAGYQNVSIWNGVQWEPIFESEYNLKDIMGINDNNIFVVGQRHGEDGYGLGVIIHYDGTNWYQYPDVTTEWGDIHRIQVFKNSIFCTMINNNQSISIIIRGE